MKWILLTGLGGDERLFAPMADLLPNYQYVSYPLPHPREAIEDFALRVAEVIPRNGPLVLCGISFGGMLSSILCTHLRPQALVLMSSASRPESLSDAARTFEWFSRMLPDTLAAWVRRLGQGATSRLEPMSLAQAASFRDMVRRAPLELIRRSARMIMEWERAPAIDCPRYHLQGGRDLLIPPHKVDATHVITDAGHLLNMTHPDPVRSFVNEVLAALNGR
jgi:pimeloyl-ACP methyl ester carboxylesterase